jgi:hypothetical protein
MRCSAEDGEEFEETEAEGEVASLTDKSCEGVDGAGVGRLGKDAEREEVSI